MNDETLENGAMVTVSQVLDGDLLLKKDWRDMHNLFGIGDYVTRDGTDVHVVVELNGPDADAGLFRCVVEPRLCDGDTEPWARIGEDEWNLTSRYNPSDWKPG